MVATRMRAVFERRLGAVRRQLPGVIAGRAESVHKMRVASRRLREAIPLLPKTTKPDGTCTPAGRRISRPLRRVTRVLGGVRELDVALAYLNEIGSARLALADAVGTVGQVIRWEREVRRQAMLRRLGRENLEKIERRILEQVVDSEVSAPELSPGPGLSRRIARRAAGVEAVVEAAGGLYAPNRLHSVRIATKKLRYALELAHELARVRALGPLRRLKRMQDLLGRMHDLEVLAGHTRLLDLQAGHRGRLHARVGLLLDAIDTEIRLLHATYLGRRFSLLEVAARCHDEFCPQLAAQSLPGAIRRSRPTSPRGSYGSTHHVVRRPTRDRRRTGQRVSR
jgi:CHAD domain-containing protein